jgi:hypothetical protein
LAAINQETSGEPFELTVIFYKQVEENKWIRIITPSYAN